MKDHHTPDNVGRKVHIKRPHQPARCDGCIASQGEGLVPCMMPRPRRSRRSTAGRRMAGGALAASGMEATGENTLSRGKAASWSQRHAGHNPSPACGPRRPWRYDAAFSFGAFIAAGTKTPPPTTTRTTRRRRAADLHRDRRRRLPAGSMAWVAITRKAMFSATDRARTPAPPVSSGNKPQRRRLQGLEGVRHEL